MKKIWRAPDGTNKKNGGIGSRIDSAAVLIQGFFTSCLPDMELSESILKVDFAESVVK